MHDDRRLEIISSKLDVLESKVDQVRADVRRLYVAVMESDESLLTRATVLEGKVKDLENQSWWMKSAVGTAILGFLFNIIFYVSTNVIKK